MNSNVYNFQIQNNFAESAQHRTTGPRKIIGAGGGFGVWRLCPPNPALAGTPQRACGAGHLPFGANMLCIGFTI
jgi:hypothetical protein